MNSEKRRSDSLNVTKSEEKIYFPLLDIGRFLAAFSVLCFHYFSITAKELEYGLVKIYLENGFFGVQFFFIISGFVIFFSLGSSLKKFAISRFLRIYPLFWFCCTVTYVITLIFSEKYLSFWIYLFNLLIINTGKTAYMVDGSYWTLTHELFFYFYIAVFVAVFGKKHLQYFFYTWLGILSCATIFNLHSLFIFKVLLIRSGYYFIFGGLLALIYSRWGTSSLREKILQVLALFISMCMPLYLSRSLQQGGGQVTNHFGMYTSTQEHIVLGMFLLATILVCFSFLIVNNTARKCCLILGGITYPLYLLHQVIGATILGITKDYGYVNMKTLLFVILVLMSSYIIYVYDKRIRKYLFTYISKHVTL